MKSREYQANHIEQIVQEVSTKRKVLAQLPTGGGKTVEFCLIAQRYIRASEKSVLILVNRQELMYQAQKTVKDILGIDPYLITSTTKKFFVSRVYIGMVGSTVSRLNLFANVGLVIIDECHIAEFNKVHHIFLEELIIGFSATPKSSSKKEPLNKYYQSLVAGPQIKELISLGYLAQNITRCPKEIVDYTKFEIDKLKGDYNERQMSAEYKLNKHVMNVIKIYHKFCLRKKTIVFNVNIEHSKEVAEMFNACGYKAKHIDADSQDREEILKWFKETEDAILCNVMIATVGYDEPTVRNIILNFSTLSLPKYIQCGGRGGRIIDEDFLTKFHSEYPYQLQLKNYFNIIDMGGNHVRFGDWNDDRDWQYVFNNPDKPNEGIAPTKTCPDCEGLIHASLRVCPLHNAEGELCLHEFERPIISEKQLDLEEIELITKGIDVDVLIGKYSNKYEYFTFLEMAVDIVKNMLTIYGNNPSQNIVTKCFEIYYYRCIEWYNKTMSGKPGNIDDISNSGWHIRKAKDNFDNLIKKYSNGEIVWDKYSVPETGRRNVTI